jgi:YgiT-type zinc finger domain-containing protein
MNETRCYVCGHSDFDERRVEYVYRRQGKYLIVRDVPCEVCLHCGERYYAGATLLQIEQRFKALRDPMTHLQPMLQVPVEAFA